jgi:1-acyl-sn-glycerol-3-phosphate acyltransferase
LFYWLLKTVVLGPVLRLLFRPWVTGLEHVPAQGGAILASNHLSFSDSIFLPLVVDRRVTFLAKSDYFTGRGAKGRATALFFRLADQLPVDRTGGRASEAALRTGLRVLRRGELLGIYPEGTRSPDGRLYRGKTGVARMALEGGVPVLPVAMVDTAKAQPIGRKIPNIVRVGVRIGAPLDFSRYEGMEDDRFVLRAITDEIMYELMQLSGQEYVDVYAADMKERLAAAKKGKPLAPPTLADDVSAAEEADAAVAHAATGAPAGAPAGATVGASEGAEPELEVEDAVADLGPAASGGPVSGSSASDESSRDEAAPAEVASPESAPAESASAEVAPENLPDGPDGTPPARAAG